MLKKAIAALILISAWLSCGGSRVCFQAAAEADASAGPFLAAFERALAGMNEYECLMVMENRKGTRREYKVSLVRFKKPNLLRLDVLEGERKGSSVVLNKRGKIKGRNAFGLTQTMKLADKRLKDIRGFTFLNSSLQDKLQCIKKQIMEKGFDAKVEEAPWKGKAAYRLHLYYNDPSDPVTDEEVWFDKETFFIIRNVKFEKENKVTDVYWPQFKINSSLKDSVFEL